MAIAHNVRIALIVAMFAAIGSASARSQSEKQAQSPPRDVRGTARVSGVVAGVDGVPVAAATLTLMSSAWKKTIAVSDDRGRFAFSALAADRYYLRAEKSGFLTTEFGALRPGGEGTPVVLSVGQRADDLTMTLVRTAAIVGTVRLSDRTVAKGMTVQVTPKNGNGITGVGHTDEQGVYRIGDLHAGQYKVQALPANGREAIPVFHPATTSPNQATTLTLEYGEEREGIDISLVEMKPVTVSGVVLDVSGLPAAGVEMFVIPVAWGGMSGNFSHTTGPGGEFSYENVFPGRYRITAYVRASPDVPYSDPATLWAVETVDVPLDVTRVLTLRMQSPLVFSGHMRFSGRTLRPPSDLTAVRVDLDQDGWKPTTVDVQPDGSFERSVLPGVYQISAYVPSPAPGWRLVSAVKDGRDLLDQPIEMSPATGSLTDIDLTFSDQPITLSGVVTLATGAPFAACHVVAFPTDRALWSPPFRRVSQRRPSTNGQFVFEELPAGDYFLAVVPNLEPGWRSADVLEPLVERATRVTLRAGDRKTQDLRVQAR